MTAPEYIQLKAFARQDGAFLALLWVATFSLYIIGVTNQILGIVAILIMVVKALSPSEERMLIPFLCSSMREFCLQSFSTCTLPSSTKGIY